MTPAEQLAAARERVVGPYLPARREWLEGWCGPLTADVEHYGVGLSCIQAPGRHGPMMGLFEVHFRFGGIVMDAEVPLSAIRLDTRIPAVRDHLVRLGCPEWARDVPAGVWAWGSGCAVSYALRAWEWDQRPGVGKRPRWVRRSNEGPRAVLRSTDTGWFYSADICGPETGDEGRACADLAAIHAGCIVRVEGGWLVPMPDGGIGFFPEVSRDE